MSRGAGLPRMRSGMPILPMSCRVAASQQVAQLLAAEPHLRAEQDRVADHPADVAAGVGVLLLQRLGEGGDHVEELPPLRRRRGGRSGASGPRMAANWRMRQRSPAVKRSRSTGLRSWTTPMTSPRASSGTARMARVWNAPEGSPCQRGSAATSLTTSASPDRATLPTIPCPTGTRMPRMAPAAWPRTTRKKSS